MYSGASAQSCHDYRNRQMCGSRRLCASQALYQKAFKNNLSALNFVILLTMPLILKIYNLSDATIRLASVLVLIHNGCAMILWPLSFVLPNALRASNDVRFTMVISIFSMWTFRIVFSYLLGQWLGWGAIGVWIAMILDWIFRVICFTVRFLSGRWQKYKPFSADT